MCVCCVAVSLCVCASRCTVGVAAVEELTWGPFQKRVFKTQSLNLNAGLLKSAISNSEFSISEHVFN